ncbi:four helix bundle protein [Pedobacter glucosidilyticus]|jgi:four helix bundle protein|uniref:Four helix bundle protein n=1 Tax=Pedobacter aquae TaxID=2605747 RepID=A0A5C0VKN9_9SPHI|nr:MULTISPECIES: four helix bundle protein [Pedobacter]KHJ39069.1 four helix bundle protein [Pedobacter glucosidilyticus]QEK52263.1 four helix bundle protein [Pedobacter aquae]
MQNYKDLRVWVKSHELTLKIYSVTKNFPKEEIYSVTSQIRRASSSIPANIAEGCGKNTKNDFGKYLNIALGSANETEYFLLLAKDLGYLPIEDYLILEKNINEVKAMLILLIQKVRA